MFRDPPNAVPLFRILLIRYQDWTPRAWDEVPQVGEPLEWVLPPLSTAAQAAQFIAGFNEEMLKEPLGVWAVAVPFCPTEGNSIASLMKWGLVSSEKQLLATSGN